MGESSPFDYLIDKVMQAPWAHEPFRHVWIDDFFSADDFSAIVGSPEVLLPTAASDEALFENLFAQGYKIIEFPGCITDRETYLRWHRDRGHAGAHNNSACEGFGMTLRLMRPASPHLQALDSFLRSEAFRAALAEKFGIDLTRVYYDCGIQKYLDGYEISPHPDIRKKALTFMVNVNPAPDSESRQHHTHYMRFTPRYRYVQAYWDGRPEADRCWVPWDWCETVRQQARNNSIVIFAPDNSTLHAVKAQYDHLRHQRTQLYGNLWFHEATCAEKPEWEDLRIEERNRQGSAPTLATRVGALVKRVSGLKGDDDPHVVRDRFGRN
jgi:hypothetical protein